MRVDGKVALISGGARGQGAAVVVGDQRIDEVEAVAASLGEAARSVALDVTDPASWDRAVAEATQTFGRLDVLVNNAGVAGFTPIIGGDVDEYDRIIAVNQRGVYLGMRAAAPAMSGGGSIINISSIDGLIGMPGVAANVASKFAVRGMTKAAALELARLEIRVNSIHPGYIDTAMVRDPLGDDVVDALARSVPLRRLGTTADIAELVLYLASDASSYCTGAEFVIDGGVVAGHTPGGRH